MDKVERVARALCASYGRDPDFSMYGLKEWKSFTEQAQAAIDAMQPDIAEADRKAREECAAICASLKTSYEHAAFSGTTLLGINECEKAILETVQ
jgi:hypothetical protein